MGCFIFFLFCFHLTATGVWNVMVEKHACLFKRPQGLFYFLYYFQWSYSCRMKWNWFSCSCRYIGKKSDPSHCRHGDI